MLSHLQKQFEKRKTLQIISQGYPVTRVPFTPPILSHTDYTRTFHSKDASLKLTFAKEGSDLVKEKSLEMIRQKLLGYFKNHPEILIALEPQFPRNLIAVEFSMHNFIVGEAGYTLRQGLELPKDAYFTYQKISENSQATYLNSIFNSEELQYLVSISYHPVPHGKPKFLKLDVNLIRNTLRRAEHYPLKPRTALSSYRDGKYYGRYCKKAGKRVAVGFKNYGSFEHVYHEEVDVMKNENRRVACEECKKDKKNYNWETAFPPSTTDQCEVLTLLQSSGIGFRELRRLTNLTSSTTIPMLHKTTNEPCPDPPELQNLVPFLLGNSDYNINNQFVAELPKPKIRCLTTSVTPGKYLHIPIASIRDSDEEDITEKLEKVIDVFNRKSGFVMHHERSPKPENLANWLVAHPDFNVHSTCGLIAKILLGAGYEDRIGGDEELEINTGYTMIAFGGDESSNKVKKSEAKTSLNIPETSPEAPKKDEDAFEMII